MNYKIINSSSKGNAVLLEEVVLIYCGVSFNKIKDCYCDIKLVVLTHIHKDHFNKTTIKRLAKERPTLRFGACEWLVEELVNLGVNKKNIDIYDLDTTYEYGDIEIRAFVLYHDVPNCGYKIIINDKKVIYATDTKTLNHVEAKDFDLYFIEANHLEHEIEEKIRAKEEKGEFAYEKRVVLTHLSKDKANEWLLQNMSQTSQFEYLHEHEEVEDDKLGEQEAVLL